MTNEKPKFTPEVQTILNDFHLNDIISHLLRRAHFIAEDIFSHEFATESITPRQKAVLVIVAKNPGLKQSELAEHLFLDRNTITDIVKRLCSNELLIRLPCQEDQRAYALNISSKGIELLNKLL
ncbi:MAG: MarR family transcriptional regulator, partial [Candidatus Acinetobacter avistercoris]|nr:MarR family transcriptional regulator [Candidatus Acinetobacter avistercoris]